MLKKFLTKKNIILISLILIIIILTLTKLTSQKNPNSNSTNNTSNTTNTPNSNQTISTKPTPTIVNVGPTTPEGYTIYYETGESSNPKNDYYIQPTIDPNEEEILDINKDFPLSRLLPYQGTYFRAERYLDVNNIEIIVSNKSQTDLAKKEAQQWLVDNGDDQYDHFTVVYK